MFCWGFCFLIALQVITWKKKVIDVDLASYSFLAYSWIVFLCKARLKCLPASLATAGPVAHCLPHPFTRTWHIVCIVFNRKPAERVSFYYFKRDSTERAKHALFGIIQLPFILSINKYLLSFQTMVYSVHFAFNFHLS